MISLIHEYAEHGFAASVNEQEYHQIVTHDLKIQIGSPYTFCVRQCLTLVNEWFESTGFDGDIAYFFESGHDGQGEADRILKENFKSQVITDHFKYVAHTFADKRVVLPLQSADIYAWQWYKLSKCHIEGRPPRKDLAALIRPRDMTIRFDAERLTGMVNYIIEQNRAYSEFLERGQFS